MALAGVGVAAVSTLAMGPVMAATTSSTSSSTSSTSSSSTSSTEAPTTTTPTAVTTTKTLTYACVGADSATTTLLDQLGPAQGLPKGSDGHYYISSQYTSKATVPKFLENGQSFAVNFSATIIIADSFTALLSDGSTIKITGALKWSVSGGGTGGPYNGTPTTGTVTVTGHKPGPVTPITASGTVTGTDKTKPIIYSLNSPIAPASIVVTIPGVAPITLNLSCTSVDPAVASTNGSLPPEPTTTTTAAPAAVNANANFTG